MVDPHATKNFLEEKKARMLGIPYKKEQGWLQVVNLEPTPIFGIAQGVKMSL